MIEFILGLIGGELYVLIEFLWRGHSHWAMFFLGGLCFVEIGLINEHRFSWLMPLWLQIHIGAWIITISELVVGLIVNRWLGWAVWDYSGMKFDFMGQICLLYFILWHPMTLLCIVVDDWLRYWLWMIFKNKVSGMEYRERPHYKLIGRIEV